MLVIAHRGASFDFPENTLPAFERAIEEVAASARTLIRSLVTTAEPRNREVEAEKAPPQHDPRQAPNLIAA